MCIVLYISLFVHPLLPWVVSKLIHITFPGLAKVKVQHCINVFLATCWQHRCDDEGINIVQGLCHWSPHFRQMQQQLLLWKQFPPLQREEMNYSWVTQIDIKRRNAENGSGLLFTQVINSYRLYLNILLPSITARSYMTQPLHLAEAGLRFRHQLQNAKYLSSFFLEALYVRKGRKNDGGDSRLKQSRTKWANQKKEWIWRNKSKT